jgi:GLPGLI family protein
LIALIACNKKNLFSKKSEGVIIYDVSFPYEENSLMLELYPKEMTAEFKDDSFHTTVKSSYGVISTEFIVNNADKSIVQLLKSFSDKFSLTVAEQDLSTWHQQFPDFTFVPTNEVDTIAGYACHKTIAKFKGDSLPNIELWHTKEIDLDHSNWWNQYDGIDGFLMSYEVEQYGKRMKLRAREVRFQPIPIEHFNVPAEYKPIDQSSMLTEIENLINEFMN